MKKVYVFTNEVITKVLDNWENYKKGANEFTDIVLQRTEKIRSAISNREALSEPHKVFISDLFFADARKMLNLYTHKFGDTIKQKELDPNFSPMKEEYFLKMKEVHAQAQEWYKSFNKAVSTYRSVKQTYEIIFSNIAYSMDIEDLLS